ncbi:MAG: sigma factor-like helix-turn-helix DNA-binding protein [Alphaproteobacteria bacterium]
MDERGSDGDDAGSAAPVGDSGSSVTASALRWLRGSRTPEGVEDVADRGAHAEDGSDDDDLELTEALSEDEQDTSDGEPQSVGPAAAEPPPVKAVAQPPQPVDRADLIYFAYDEDDDIDDFDDLGDLDEVAQRPPVRSTPVFAPAFAEIDLEETSSADDLDEAPVIALEPAEAETGPDEPDAPVAPPASAAPETKRTAVEPPAVLARVDTFDEDVLASKLDKAAIASIDSSLALQPIPELQPDFSPLVAKSATPKADADQRRQDDQTDGHADDHRPASEVPVPSAETGDEDPPETALADDEADDLDLDASLLADDDEDSSDIALQLADEEAEFDALDDDTLELDSPWTPPEDQDGDQSGGDWHAHLAEALAGDDEPEPVTPAPPALPAPKAAGGEENGAAALPLSSTLARLAATDEEDDDDDEDVFLPPVIIDRPRRRLETSPPPAALTHHDGPPTAEQLSLGIIAHVPRLRRFAAVQIGDELEADRLVQVTIKTALADLHPLAAAPDLGLALLARMYRERQRMLSGGALARLPEEARAFETALCHGLAGADQFEIHQLARAMNGLEEADRELLALAALENLTYREIGEIIEHPDEQIMARLAEARMRLRQALDIDHADSSGDIDPLASAHPREFEIHGYLDGELDGRHMADIDSLVEDDQDAADRLLHYGIQGDLIRRLYAPLLNRPLPASLLEALSVAMKAAAAARTVRRGFPFRSRRALLAGAFMVTLAGSAALTYFGLLPTIPH